MSKAMDSSNEILRWKADIVTELLEDVKRESRQLFGPKLDQVTGARRMLPHVVPDTKVKLSLCLKHHAVTTLDLGTR
jgi:hypothetical protein